MSGDPMRTLVDRLGDLFEQNRDEARARRAAAYMRDQFAFYGIPAPEQRRIARAATAALSAPDQAQLSRLVTVCWRKPEREWQYFACGYLRRHVRACSDGFLGTAKVLITTKSWWDTVDALAAHTVGPLVAKHPRLVLTMDRWIDSKDIWLARTALLHQLHYKTATDTGRLFAYCLRRADSSEFFIRKAIGWALREYSKTDGKAVRSFVRAHSVELSGLSRTEALKWLDRRATRGRGA